ncbi:PASTA domain-containing protein [Actinocrispum wychmicini]
MPNLVGMKRQAAIDLLRSKGWDGQLSPSNVPTTNPAEDGQIVDQNPDAGQQVGKNQAVDVKIAKFGPGG